MFLLFPAFLVEEFSDEPELIAAYFPSKFARLRTYVSPEAMVLMVLLRRAEEAVARFGEARRTEPLDISIDARAADQAMRKNRWLILPTWSPARFITHPLSAMYDIQIARTLHQVGDV